MTPQAISASLKSWIMCADAYPRLADIAGHGTFSDARLILEGSDHRWEVGFPLQGAGGGGSIEPPETGRWVRGQLTGPLINKCELCTKKNFEH